MRRGRKGELTWRIKAKRINKNTRNAKKQQQKLVTCYSNRVCVDVRE